MTVAVQGTNAHLVSDVERIATTFQGRLGCVVRDMRGHIWASCRATERFPTASVIKVPILVALANAVDQGRLAWEQIVPPDLREMAAGSGVIQFLSSLPYTLKDLATLMIIVSDNRATNVIIDFLGMEPINNYFARTGWNHTILARHMWDLDARSNGRDNFSTPADMSDLFARLHNAELVTPATSTLLLEILKGQQLRDRLPARIPPSITIAHKTGGPLGGVQNDCGILFLPAGPVVAAVFVSDVDSDADGTQAIQLVGRAIFEASLAKW